jgi:heat shock protein HtpX
MYYGGGGRRRSSSDGAGQLQLVFFAISIVLMILAPFLAQIIYFAASRKREYLADACGALYTRYPDGLASALEKITNLAQPVQSANRVTAPMYIVNPMYAAGRTAVGLFSTHPPTEARIRILRGMEGAASLDAYQKQWQQAGGGGGKLFSSHNMKFAPAGAAPVHAAARGSMAGPVAPAPTARSQEPVDTRTAVNDVLWKQQGYSVIDCNCGVRLKVPPQLQGQEVMCPKCRSVYSVR